MKSRLPLELIKRINRERGRKLRLAKSKAKGRVSVYDDAAKSWRVKGNPIARDVTAGELIPLLKSML